MNRTLTNEEIEGVVKEVSRRSSIDPQFRTLALSDASAAIAKISEKALPSSVSFKFVDNSGSVKTIPLPDPVQEITQEELSDLEIESVAGGASTVSVSSGWSS